MHGHVILVCIEPKMRRFENAHVSSSMRALITQGSIESRAFLREGIFDGWMDRHWARKMTIDDTPRAPCTPGSTCNDHVKAIDRHDD